MRPPRRACRFFRLFARAFQITTDAAIDGTRREQHYGQLQHRIHRKTPLRSQANDFGIDCGNVSHHRRALRIGFVQLGDLERRPVFPTDHQG